jgi:hypothetical protein
VLIFLIKNISQPTKKGLDYVDSYQNYIFKSLVKEHVRRVENALAMV